MGYILSFETVDGNGEEEEEFDTLEKAATKRDELEPFLLWHDITGPDGEIVVA